MKPVPDKPLGIDLTDLLEKLGYIKRVKGPPKHGQARFNARDTKTTAQLAAEEWSGIRANDMWNRFELWILGRIDRTLTYQAFFLKPQSLNEMYCEAFGLDHINLDAKAQEDIKKLEERKALLSEPEVQRALDALESPPAEITNLRPSSVATSGNDKSKKDQ